ncbi:MAG: sporulation integral membrane protein YtvI [Clostridia bacterium]|nr:sporulation integral membrane protein YtvI [Clostridia bacterium]
MQNKILYSLVTAALALLGVYLGFKYALPVALPFLVSFFIACSVQKAAGRFAARTGAGKRFVSLCMGLLFLFAVGFVFFLCVSKLWGELAELASGAIAAREEILSRTQSVLRRAESFILRFFPAAFRNAEALRARMEILAEEMLRSVISALSTKIPAFMGQIFSEVPKILFSLGVTLVSCVYFCLDFDKIRAFAKKHMSRGGFAFLLRVPGESFHTLARYLRAVFIMFLMTAALLAVGFLVLGVEYAWLIAVGAAFVDALPVFGSGAVLLPYAALRLIAGDFRRGIGVLVLWGAVSLLRQAAEPRIMGKNLGVHPLVNLAAVYVGYSFFGVTGVVFLPITVVIAKNLFCAREA